MLLFFCVFFLWGGGGGGRVYVLHTCLCTNKSALLPGNRGLSRISSTTLGNIVLILPTLDFCPYFPNAFFFLHQCVQLISIFNSSFKNDGNVFQKGIIGEFITNVKYKTMSQTVSRQTLCSSPLVDKVRCLYSGVTLWKECELSRGRYGHGR